jgi:hypothetical protein
VLRNRVGAMDLCLLEFCELRYSFSSDPLSLFP